MNSLSQGSDPRSLGHLDYEKLRVEFALIAKTTHSISQNILCLSYHLKEIVPHESYAKVFAQKGPSFECSLLKLGFKHLCEFRMMYRYFLKGR